ncbi:MAG TPA: glycosyltransferase [Xanthobacteraceae bacterium]|nr:glycosyltransferase [Xanthobacteraceae bacterium]
MNEVVFAVPGDLANPTGGYAYDRRIIEGLAALGWRTAVVDLGDGFPFPTNAARAAARTRLAALPIGPPIVIDGLAFGALPEAAAALGATHSLVALVHHPLALETGLSAAASASLRASERTALACARHVIATSTTTARLLAADYDVPSERLSVVEPGTERVATGPRRVESVIALLSVGAVVPRKGYDVLVAALARLKHLPWRLVIAGDCGRSVDTFRRLVADVAALGLSDRVRLAGTVTAEELASLYASADLFVLPSRFEGYGMAYAEAIAHGVPVIGTNAGAIPETVPADAGVLVPPDDVDILAATLQRLMDNPAERERLAAGARATAFPSWRGQAALFARALESLR